MKLINFPILLFVFATSGCAKEEPLPPQAIRAIKTTIVQQSPAIQVRRISGITSAAVETDLSMEVSGRLVQMSVDSGTRVKRGTTIARIDPTPYELRRQNAVQRLDEQVAVMADARSRFEKLSRVFDDGFVSEVEFDAAKASFERAQAAVASASTQVALADRDLANTTLLAPFDGTVTDRFVDEFNDVAAGQRIVTLTADQGINVEVMVPEVLVNEISVGDEAKVHLSGTTDQIHTGHVSRVNAKAADINAFEVVIAVDGPTPLVKPGMSAEVEFSFAANRRQTAFTLPATAVMPGDGQTRKGVVYVFDQQERVVRARHVEVVGLVDNMVEVVGDVHDGERVAVAGVSFLLDGMPVKLMELNPGESK